MSSNFSNISEPSKSSLFPLLLHLTHFIGLKSQVHPRLSVQSAGKAALVLHWEGVQQVPSLEFSGTG